jgi:hypothetical protein
MKWLFRLALLFLAAIAFASGLQALHLPAT